MSADRLRKRASSAWWGRPPRSEFVSTATETEAAAAEANLIKRCGRDFNVLMRDRQVVPLYPDHRRTMGSRRSSTPGARSRPGKLLRPVRLGLGGLNSHQSRRLQGAFCCAHARIVLRQPNAAVLPTSNLSAARARAPREIEFSEYGEDGA